MIPLTYWLVACASTIETRGPPGTGGALDPIDSPPTTPPTGGTPTEGDTGALPCEPGRSCNPFEIVAFPYTDDRDTLSAADQEIDAYGCDPTIDESGGEYWYVLEILEPGRLTAEIDEVAGDGVDIDVHLLDAVDPEACLDRGHEGISALLDPGTYYLVLDTWGGPDQAGPYRLEVDFSPGSVDCAFVPTDVEMFWTSCAPGIDCITVGNDVFLVTPSEGPVVKEAHLVTAGESFGGNGWPVSFTDQIGNHYTVSEFASGYVMSRAEPWAPAGEGGSEFGQGATGAPVPAEDEAFYITMYWRDRPVGGTRMLVRNPANGRTVVASAGWETGPGANTAVAGVSEEIHDWLGTGHLSVLEIGFAADPTLPLGPVDCP